jgi:hypothetical protein
MNMGNEVKHEVSVTKVEPVITRVDSPAPLGVETLMKMLIESQAETAKANKALAEAIMESRKPYVDPKVLEQKRKDLEDRQKQIQQDQRIRAATKRICPHVRENGTQNIKWMEHSNGITMGVCGTCRSEFDTRNPEDLALLRRDLKSIKNMGRSGSHARRGAVLEA